MYLIKLGEDKLIISDYELNYYAKKDGFEIIKELNGYPSLNKLKVEDRKNLNNFINYLENKINEHDNNIRKYKDQLKQFKKDCEGLL